MNQTPPPSASELGISDIQYERILRDLGRRGSDGEPVATPAPRRSPWRHLPLGVLVLLVVFITIGRLGPTGGHEPAYAFIETVDGRPVTYSSCSVIQVAVYPSGGPPDAEQLVREAVATMRSATGLDIVVAGAFGGHAPNWNFKAAPVTVGDPISVSWHDSDSIAEVTDEVAGVGGSRRIPAPNGGQRWVAGTIALSSDYYEQLTARSDHDESVAVLLHEFGHVFGLDHVDSPGELMYAHNIGRTTLGPGDLEGLRRLGQGPCL
jgi:hypothetical protein